MTEEVLNQRIGELNQSLQAVVKSVSEHHNTVREWEIQLDGRVKNIEAMTQKIDLLLTGNGTPEKGFIYRIMMAERAMGASRWFFRVCLVAIITGFFGALFFMVLKIHP